MNLLVIGEIETVYTLTCEIIEKQHHDLAIGEVLHEYL